MVAFSGTRRSCGSGLMTWGVVICCVTQPRRWGRGREGRSSGCPGTFRGWQCEEQRRHGGWLPPRRSWCFVSVEGEDAVGAQLLGKRHERCVGQIHRPVSVLVEEVEHT